MFLMIVFHLLLNQFAILRKILFFLQTIEKELLDFKQNNKCQKYGRPPRLSRMNYLFTKVIYLINYSTHNV